MMYSKERFKEVGKVEALRKQAAKRFYYLRKLIKDEYDSQEQIDFFIFNRKAINYVKKIFKRL